MKIKLEKFEVTKLYPLTISRGTSTGSENLLVSVEHEEITGIGEMAPCAGGAVVETVASAMEAYSDWIPALQEIEPWEMQRIEAILSVKDDQRAAYCALECALFDWMGKRLGIPVWRMLGLNQRAIPHTSLTIGINPPEVIRERVPELLARTSPYFLKVKLGNPAGIEADQASFMAAQEAELAYSRNADRVRVGWRVDANGGWNVADARKMMRWLAERGVEFIEQPLKCGEERYLPELYSGRPLPIYVDETICTATDIVPVADHVDGVNLKFMKCGGIREAIRIIHTARAHHLKVMIGCMSETSLAITAAAHLGSLVDALDLDSHLNLNPDPFIGAHYVNGKVVPTDAPGLGVIQRSI